MSQCNCFVWPTTPPGTRRGGPLVGCCHTMELFRLVLSHNGIIWFNSYNLYNFCCPRVTHNFYIPLEPTQLFHHPLSNTTFFSCPKEPPCGGGDEDTLFLAVSSCHNIMFLHVVTQWNCLVWCCRTMELFGLVLSYNGIVWFGVVRQWNCLVW